MNTGKTVKKNFLKKKKRKGGVKINHDSTGDRTQNLWFRRPAPYPLGHGVFHAVVSITLLY